MDALTVVITDIMNGYQDDMLDVLKDAIRQREVAISFGTKSTPRDIMDDFKVGDVVAFNSKARPMYLKGLRGLVTKVNHKTVILSIEDKPQARRFAGVQRVRTPKNIVDVVS